MDSPPRLRASRFVVAVAGSVVLVLSAPFIGYVRAWIRSQFPGRFVPIVGGLIAVLGVTAIGLALARVRERRAIRYAAIAGSLICAALYSIATATGVPEVDVVQRFHFIEYGLITFLFYRAWRPLEDPSIVILPVLASLLVGTADEWLQWFIPNRVGELDDIFLNGIAIACGLVFSLGTDPPAAFHRALRPGSLRRIGRFGAAFVVALAAFFHTVHLGHDIHDEEIGVFKSRYSKAQAERDDGGEARGVAGAPATARPAARVAGRSVHERRGDARPGAERARGRRATSPPRGRRTGSSRNTTRLCSIRRRMSHGRDTAGRPSNAAISKRGCQPRRPRPRRTSARPTRIPSMRGRPGGSGPARSRLPR